MTGPLFFASCLRVDADASRPRQFALSGPACFLSERGFVAEWNQEAGVVDPPGVDVPPPGVVPGVGAGAGVVGAGVLAPGAGLVAGAEASSFLLQALSATASTDAIIKVLLIIFRLL